MSILTMEVCLAALLALTTRQAEAVVGAASTRPVTLALLPREAPSPS